LIQNRKFRNAILKLLVKIYSNLPNPDYVNLVQCLIYLDEPEQVATVLENLIRSNNYLMAYQLGLDLYESATQQFLLKVKNLLKALITITQPMEMESDSTPEVKTEPTISTTSTTESKASTVNDEVKTNIEKMLIILNGEITINSNMQFLIKNNHSDLLVLKTIKVIIKIIYFNSE
jgi:26S proteasome regulatory subunit N2